MPGSLFYKNHRHPPRPWKDSPGIPLNPGPWRSQERTPQSGRCLLYTSETEPMARFEMCRKDEFQERDLEQNGYAQHKKLGETEEYVYYLSWNESGNEQAAELFALSLIHICNGPGRRLP